MCSQVNSEQFYTFSMWYFNIFYVFFYWCETRVLSLNANLHQTPDSPPPKFIKYIYIQYQLPYYIYINYTVYRWVHNNIVFGLKKYSSNTHNSNSETKTQLNTSVNQGVKTGYIFRVRVTGLKTISVFFWIFSAGFKNG